MHSSLGVGALVLCAVAAFAGCHRPVSGGIGSASQPDSLVGVVSVAGTSFEQHVVLRVAGRVQALVTTSADSASLSRVAGTEVVIRGRAERSSFRVVSFTVRSVDGAPVADGTLLREGGLFVLQTAGGPREVRNAPASFGSMIGARIWVGGPLDTGPNVYGVITPAR
jgi:hypothetical protein